jgi:hypothetical protein
VEQPVRPNANGQDDHYASVVLPGNGRSGMPQHFFVLTGSYADEADVDLEESNRIGPARLSTDKGQAPRERCPQSR